MLAAQGQYAKARQQIQALEKLNIGGRLDGSMAGLRTLIAAPVKVTVVLTRQHSHPGMKHGIMMLP